VVDAQPAILGGDEIMYRSNKPIAQRYEGGRAGLVGKLFITGDFS
jgi:hypothetical protein